MNPMYRKTCCNSISFLPSEMILFKINVRIIFRIKRYNFLIQKIHNCIKFVWSSRKLRALINILFLTLLVLFIAFSRPCGLENGTKRLARLGNWTKSNLPFAREIQDRSVAVRGISISTYDAFLSYDSGLLRVIYNLAVKA